MNSTSDHSNISYAYKHATAYTQHNAFAFNSFCAFLKTRGYPDTLNAPFDRTTLNPLHNIYAVMQTYNVQHAEILEYLLRPHEVDKDNRPLRNEDPNDSYVTGEYDIRMCIASMIITYVAHKAPDLITKPIVDHILKFAFTAEAGRSLMRILAYSLSEIAKSCPGHKGTIIDTCISAKKYGDAAQFMNADAVMANIENRPSPLPSETIYINDKTYKI